MAAAQTVHNMGMEDSHAHRVLKAAQALRASLVLVITHVDVLCDLIEGTAPTIDEPPPAVAGPGGRPLRVERSTYSVTWGPRRCVLGHTMAFDVMERLARRPNEYINMERLLDDLWTGPRAYSTVRSTICRLKSKLRGSGMGDLADLIDGGMHGHYGLMLQRA